MNQNLMLYIANVKHIFHFNFLKTAIDVNATLHATDVCVCTQIAENNK